jgi:hypothetical protein
MRPAILGVEPIFLPALREPRSGWGPLAGCPGRSLPIERSIHGGEQPLAIVVVVDSQSEPITAVPQIGEEACTILVKMQKCSAFGVKDAGLALYQAGPVPQFLQQFAQHGESFRARMFHLRSSGAC